MGGSPPGQDTNGLSGPRLALAVRIRVVLTALAACLTLAAITALVLDW